MLPLMPDAPSANANPSECPFSTWMEKGLYDPQKGYYARQIQGIGRRGDFTTSASLDGFLGEAIAQWVKTERKLSPSVSTIIEIGGGDGSLAKSVLRALGWLGRRRFRFIMVERSSVLRTLQEKMLTGYGVRWYDHPTPALKACGGEALIYHNELIDAFPVQLAQLNAATGQWQEVWVERAAGRFQETLHDLSLQGISSEDFSALRQWNAATPPPYANQRVELGSAALRWFGEWAPQWKRGTMLTLDYGDAFPSLYYRRPAGTLRAYLLHQVLSGAELYQNMGRQDLTCDVNFSDLQVWGERFGWANQPLMTQAEFLQAYLKDYPRRMKANKALAFLGDAEGAGGAFKALVQRIK